MYDQEGIRERSRDKHSLVRIELASPELQVALQRYAIEPLHYGIRRSVFKKRRVYGHKVFAAFRVRKRQMLTIKHLTAQEEQRAARLIFRCERQALLDAMR